jgi:hypothetical protein
MTIQAKISLPDEVFHELERRAPLSEGRSRLVTEALCYFFASHNDVNELEKINQHAEELNQEAEDVLGYQVDYGER